MVYSRAELRGSDHKPGYSLLVVIHFISLIPSEVFGLFRANVWIVDTAKRAVLSRLLLESVLSTSPGEKLDEKLASLTLPTDLVEREYMLS